MKKAISLSICLFLLLSLAVSCGKQAADVNPLEAGDNDPYGRYEQTLTMTTAKVNNVNPNLPDGMTMEDNPLFDALKERLNIDLQVAWMADNYPQQMALNIMTGDIPDIINIPDYQIYQQLIANDLIQPLNGLMEIYGNEYMKNTYATYGEDYFDFTTLDGNLMAIPGNAGGYMQNLLWVRKDWLDALNLQPPKTLDEIINVAQQFMQRDPGNNGPGNTVGINSYREHSFLGNANQYGLETICYLNNAYPGSWMAGADGGVFYGSVQPEMKTALTQIKSMYDIGVLDPFSFEQGWEEIRDNVQEGRTGLWFTGWSFGYNTPDFINFQPDAELICYPAPLDENGVFSFVDSNNVRNWYAVRKGFDNPEALFKILNVCFDIWLGFDEEYFDQVAAIRERGSNWTSAIPTGDFNIVQYDIIPVLGEATRRYIDEGVMDTTLIPSDQYMVRQAAAWADGSSTFNGDWIVYMSRYVSSPQTRTGVENILKAAFHYSTDKMADRWESLYALEREMYRQILSGEMPIDYFDEFVTQWYEMGGREVTAEVDQLVNQSKGR